MKIPATRDVGVAVILALVLPFLSSCKPQEAAQKTSKRPRVVTTSPQVKDVNITHQYFCHIHAQRHIKVATPVNGFLEEVEVKPGQAVKEGDLLFKVMPKHYHARLDALVADAKIAELELDDARQKSGAKGLSQPELAVHEAKLAKARAQVAAEMEGVLIKAPFDGLVEKLQHAQGSLVEKGDTLTTLSDHSQLRAYFHVPEARYLEYMADLKKHKEDLQIELVLSNGQKFEHTGTLGAIDAGFNHETGNIGFRADFPNPDGRLRHGQAGQVQMHMLLRDAMVIPQRAMFEILHKKYVFVVDNAHVAHRREIVVSHELDDIFVVASGLAVEDKIVVEGGRKVTAGDRVEDTGQ